MRRNLLDAYVSNVIATSKKEYTKVKTDNVKINFQAEHFTKWLNRVEDYYSFLNQFATESPEEYKHLSYEDIHRHQQEHDKFAFIIDFLKQSGFEINKSQNVKKIQKVKLHKKQDSRTNVFDKVSNPDILRNFLIKKQLEYLV